MKVSDSRTCDLISKYPVTKTNLNITKLCSFLDHFGIAECRSAKCSTCGDNMICSRVSHSRMGSSYGRRSIIKHQTRDSRDYSHWWSAEALNKPNTEEPAHTIPRLFVFYSLEFQLIATWQDRQVQVLTRHTRLQHSSLIVCSNIHQL